MNKDKLVTIKCIYNNKEYSFELDFNSSVIDVLKLMPDKIKKEVIGVKINNEIVSFNTKLKKDVVLEFFDVNDLAGYKIYQAGLKFVMELGLKELYGNQYKLSFNHSIMRGIHISVLGDNFFTKEETNRLYDKMQEIVNRDLKFIEYHFTSKDAYEHYMKDEEYDKAMNIHNVSNRVTTLYKLGDLYNYYYMDLPYSTGCLNRFEVVYIKPNEIVLLFPNPHSNFEVPPYIHYEKIIKCFKDEHEWLKIKNISYVYNVNNLVMMGMSGELIHYCEVNYNNRVHDVARNAINSGAKFIMVGGPSSSGKTTTTKKIALSLEALGKHAILISVDDYFKNREDSPKHPDGSYDFECLEALDLDLLNKDLTDLLSGKEVNFPTYNFITGKREYDKNKVLRLDDNSIILMEGLHCLNDELTRAIPRELKYVVYLSPFMALRIDRDNYISTTDLRLLRRIIRDFRTRGKDAATSIETWQSVRSGEEKYIFPYINNCDCIMNTSLAYELGVLKLYVEPLLYSVDNSSPYYEEARRLIRFLRNYLAIPSDSISDDCVLREFIGGLFFER